MLSDEKLLRERFEAWCERDFPVSFKAYREGYGSHNCNSQIDLAWNAWRELAAAVRAEREGVEPVAWCTRGFAGTFEYAGSLEEAQRNRACYEQLCDSPDMSVPLQQQPEPLYLHPPQDSATVPDDVIDAVSKALRKAWQLGQTYWHQADHEFASYHRKADETQAKFDALLEETSAMLANLDA